MFRSISEAVAYGKDTHPDRLCIADEDREYTYEQFFSYACQLANLLCGLENKTIAMRCTQDAAFLAMKMACEISRNIFVPIEKDASVDRAKEIIEESKAQLLFGNIEGISCQCLDVPQYEESGADYRYDFPLGDSISEILYTTGTTGKSKGVVISNYNNIALAENIMYGAEIKENNVELISLPISHSHALRSCYANFLRGGSIVLADGLRMIKNVLEKMEKYHVTSIDFSPSAAKIFMTLAKDKFYAFADQLDYIEIGTAVLDETTKKILIEKFPNTRLYNFYGSTESGRSCVLDFSKNNKEKCVGKPTINSHFIITDESRKEIVSSKDNLGLLACSGPMNMKGYWNQPELSSSIMHDGYIYTNDLAYIDEEGYVYVYGRNGTIINFGGIKIAPEEVEEQVIRFENVADCALVPKKDDIYGQIPFLYVVAKEGNDLDKTCLLDFIKRHVDSNKIPKRIEIIEKIPRTFNGKIKRDELIKLCNKDK